MPDPKMFQLLAGVGIAVGGFIGGVVIALRRKGPANGLPALSISNAHALIESVHAIEVEIAVMKERSVAAIARLGELEDRVRQIERWPR